MEETEEEDLMEILSREAPKKDDVPEEKTVPPELLEDLVPEEGLSYRYLGPKRDPPEDLEL